MTSQRIIIAILFAWTLLAVFAHLGDVQLEFFDEARRGVSALEMSRGEAPSLLTPPYYGAPDHWGTKPPLLVWCQVIWIKIIWRLWLYSGYSPGGVSATGEARWSVHWRR
jgi:hypothetical protein